MASNFTVKEVPDRAICVMRAQGELDLDQRKDFSFSAEQLLASDQPKLVLDLTKVSRMFSIFIGTIVDLNQRATQNGKVFSVLAGKKVADLFEQANLNETIPVVVVD